MKTIMSHLYTFMTESDLHQSQSMNNTVTESHINIHDKDILLSDQNWCMLLRAKVPNCELITAGMVILNV